MRYLGDFTEDSTHYFTWGTIASGGQSVTRATDGTVTIWKNGDSTAASTTGITDAEDEGANTGLHRCTMVLTDAFYTTGADYDVVLLGATIDGKVVNAILAHFSIENRKAVLSAAGQQDIAQLINVRPTWEVNKAGNDANGGLSWDDAFLTIGVAVAAAAAGDRINIGPGTYVEAVDSSAKANVELVGAGMSTIISQTAASTLKIGNGTTVRDMKMVAAEAPFVTPSGAKYGIECVDRTDIRLINVSAFGDWGGLYAREANRLWIENCHLSGRSYGACFNAAGNVRSLDTIYETDGSYSATESAWAILAEPPFLVGSNLLIRGGALICRRAASTSLAAVGLATGSYGQHILEGVLIIVEQQHAGSSGGAYGVAEPEGLGNLADVVLSNSQIYTSQAGSGAEYHLSNDTGSILVNEGTLYDRAKTNGAITASGADVLQRTTIAAYTSNTSFTLSVGSANDDAYNGCLCLIQDQTTAAQKAVGVVSDYTGATKTVTLAADPSAAFTFANGDIVTILAGNAALNFKVYVDSWTVE